MNKAKSRREIFWTDVDMGEILDPTPVEIPVDATRESLSIQDELKRFIRTELSAMAQQMGMETFEEADDFDEEDDYNEEEELYDEISQYTIYDSDRGGAGDAEGARGKGSAGSEERLGGEIGSGHTEDGGESGADDVAESGVGAEGTDPVGNVGNGRGGS